MCMFKNIGCLCSCNGLLFLQPFEGPFCGCLALWNLASGYTKAIPKHEYDPCGEYTDPQDYGNGFASINNERKPFLICSHMPYDRASSLDNRGGFYNDSLDLHHQNEPVENHEFSGLAAHSYGDVSYGHGMSHWIGYSSRDGGGDVIVSFDITEKDEFILTTPFPNDIIIDTYTYPYCYHDCNNDCPYLSFLNESLVLVCPRQYNDNDEDDSLVVLIC